MSIKYNNNFNEYKSIKTFWKVLKATCSIYYSYRIMLNGLIKPILKHISQYFERESVEKNTKIIVRQKKEFIL